MQLLKGKEGLRMQLVDLHPSGYVQVRGGYSWGPVIKVESEVPRSNKGSIEYACAWRVRTHETSPSRKR